MDHVVLLSLRRRLNLGWVCGIGLSNVEGFATAYIAFLTVLQGKWMIHLRVHVSAAEGGKCTWRWSHRMCVSELVEIGRKIGECRGNDPRAFSPCRLSLDSCGSDVRKMGAVINLPWQGRKAMNAARLVKRESTTCWCPFYQEILISMI